MSTKAERTEAIDLLEKDFNEAKGIYFTDFNRVNVEKMTQLRAEFRQQGAKYKVVKNTLASIALERCGKKDLIAYLKGPVGIATHDSEPTAPAKVIKDFHKANKDLLPCNAAMIEGTVFDADQVDKLADMPSKDVLLSLLLSALKAPVTNFAGALNGILTKFAGTLEAVKNKKESENS
ncbi:MAG: 50S ribosomal protein L10 [Chitinivibrionales bacterium]|nr:50S ribosomal protein L10 [Chitinivibrionales bacterium]